MLNDLLEELKRRGCKVIAYAEDVAVIVRGKIFRYSDGTDVGLSQSSCEMDRGLSMNPLKTVLALFTRRYKIPRVFLLCTWDLPLTWKPNIEERIRKTAAALCDCRDAIGKRWGP